jgi:hypothetical protein
VSRTTLTRFSIGALGVLMGVAALQAARAEPVPPKMSAINDSATVNSQMKRTLAAISNIAVARRARSGGRDYAGRARNSFSADHMDSRLRGDLVGGSFAWPYYNYCMRHPGDQNC